MDELVKMKKLVDKGKLHVIPIFYKVKALDVKKQTGEFGINFWSLAKVSSGDQIKKWKDALECISNKMGLSLGDKRYFPLTRTKSSSCFFFFFNMLRCTLLAALKLILSRK